MSNTILLIAILLLLIVEPFFSEQGFGRIVFDVMVSAVLVAAVWALSRRRSLLVAGLLFVTPAFIGRWVLYVVDSHWLAVAWLLLTMAFLLFTAVVVLRQALGGTEVTTDTIAGAICAYLLLGVIWAFTFALTELLHPSSFLMNGQPLSATSHPDRQLIPEFLYLSLVTLSTVGYGDIVPITPPARMLAALEAVVGQLYLAVFIARLIGLNVPRGQGAGGPRSGRLWDWSPSPGLGAARRLDLCHGALLAELERLLGRADREQVHTAR